MCGICGYVGNKPADPLFIKILLMYNETRGDDATGFVINNIIKKDNDKVTKFLQTNPIVISPDDVNFTVIAHARKRSVGWNTKENAHPVGMYKGGAEKEDYDLVLAMNGTIENKDEIADKFNAKFPNMHEVSDTRILAKAMTEAGEKGFKKVIEGYSGIATLVFFSPKYPNQLMVYKDTQRPLFYWEKSENEMYISSMEEPLRTLDVPKEAIKSFEDEHLYTIKEGKIIHDIKIIRNPIKPVSKVKQLNYYEDVDYGYPKNKSTWDYKAGQWVEDNDSWKGNSRIRKNDLHSAMVVDAEIDIVKLGKDQESTINRRKDKSKIYVILDRYQRNGHYLTGSYIVDNDGKEVTNVVDHKGPMTTLFCINGYRCKGKPEYDILLERLRRGKKDNGLDLTKWRITPLSEYVEYFKYPAMTQSQEGHRWALNEEWEKTMHKAGGTFNIDIFLCSVIYTCKYTDKQTVRSQKLLCKTESIITRRSSLKKVDNEDDDIYLTHDQHQLMCILTDEISSSNIIEAGTIMRAFSLKVQKSCDGDLRRFFFNLLVDLLNKEGIINDDSMAEFKSDKDFKTVGIVKEIDDALKIYKKRLNKTAEDDDRAPSDGDLLKELGNKNQTYQKPGFNNEMWDTSSEELSDIFETWGDKDNPREFYEAVLLSMNNLQTSKDKEIYAIINGDELEMRAEAIRLYSLWFKINTEQKEKEPEEDVEEQAVIENPTPGEWEKDVIIQLIEHKAGLTSTVDMLKSYADIDKTENIRKIQKVLQGCEEILEKTYNEVK